MKCPCINCICRPICRSKGIRTGQYATDHFALDLAATCPFLNLYIQEGFNKDIRALKDDEISEYQRRIIRVRLLFNINVDQQLKDIYEQQFSLPDA